MSLPSVLLSPPSPDLFHSLYTTATTTSTSTNYTTNTNRDSFTLSASPTNPRALVFKRKAVNAPDESHNTRETVTRARTDTNVSSTPPSPSPPAAHLPTVSLRDFLTQSSTNLSQQQRHMPNTLATHDMPNSNTNTKPTASNSASLLMSLHEAHRHSTAATTNSFYDTQITSANRPNALFADPASAWIYKLSPHKPAIMTPQEINDRINYLVQQCFPIDSLLTPLDSKLLVMGMNLLAQQQLNETHVAMLLPCIKHVVDKQLVPPGLRKAFATTLYSCKLRGPLAQKPELVRLEHVLNQQLVNSRSSTTTTTTTATNIPANNMQNNVHVASVLPSTQTTRWGDPIRSPPTAPSTVSQQWRNLKTWEMRGCEIVDSDNEHTVDVDTVMQAFNPPSQHLPSLTEFTYSTSYW